MYSGQNIVSKKFAKDAYHNSLMIGIQSPESILKIHLTHTRTHTCTPEHTCLHSDIAAHTSEHLYTLTHLCRPMHTCGARTLTITRTHLCYLSHLCPEIKSGYSDYPKSGFTRPILGPEYPIPQIRVHKCLTNTILMHFLGNGLLCSIFREFLQANLPTYIIIFFDQDTYYVLS